MKDIEGDVPETTNELKILEAYKGPFNSGDSVTVAEAFFLQDDQYVQIEGYTPLVEEREYILFIEEGLKDESGNLVYGISSLDFGKYSQEGEVASVDFTTFNNVNELSKYDFIKEDPHHNDLYNESKKDVLRKYY
ncbi:hypothetical protein RYX56_06560 [Alkalihalophilus lindianensis]|uniref:Lipoprotein n=1 Tax=Alkalihalophilus lindianensis TaxID=1630542 RepID=A0ABU3X8S2_9BACI|nr:hypothetical protein [Alkalihalophilus lindianensis]MDV2684032.1 hypothetical protein [Alkalihalophilus lindianensis]